METVASKGYEEIKKTENELRSTMESNQMLDRINQEQEEALAKRMREIEEKAARVDKLEQQMANLEMDKEIMKQ